MNTKTKKFLNVLLMGSAVSTRNLTSLALVALFFAIYVAAGGRISSVPKVKSGEGFGSAQSADHFRNAMDSVTKTADKDVTSKPPVTKVTPAKPTPKEIDRKINSASPKATNALAGARATESDSKNLQKPELSKDNRYPEDHLADIERRLKLRK